MSTRDDNGIIDLLKDFTALIIVSELDNMLLDPTILVFNEIFKCNYDELFKEIIGEYSKK